MKVMDLLVMGNKQRTSEPTAANKTSSRSHAILQVGDFFGLLDFYLTGLSSDSVLVNIIPRSCLITLMGT